MDSPRVSSYLQYLPAILQEGEFIGRFLLAFEATLSGIAPEGEEPISTTGPVFHAGIPPIQPLSENRGLALPTNLKPPKIIIGLETILDHIEAFFDPDRTPEDFLPWLAQWVATSLRDDWSVATKRKFIGQIIPLYKLRGTRAGIQKVLELSDVEAKIVDFHDGKDVEVEEKAFGSGAKPPHFFGVIVTLRTRNPALLANTIRRVRAIVDREKPAHTYYGLQIWYPAMQINDNPQNTAFGEGIIIGQTTSLGTITANKAKI